ncbi:Thiamin-phosphate pyrophosphorylase [Minicystis rosea]|nr:Thiamin-phosphate pyrophosphorylase [Minicystis rosea]
MRGLYAIVDVDSLTKRGLDPLWFAEIVLAEKPAAIQLRDKSGGARRTLAWLRAIAPIAARAGVPLFANDRPDLAILAGCDGVHVGQDDLPVATVRSLAPARGLRVGLSTHDAEQLEAAIAEGPDYIAIGPIFPTASKEKPDPVVGIEGLRALAARVRAARPGLPIVAIGGITAANAAEVGAIADMAAVIQAILPTGDGAPEDEIRAKTRAFGAALRGEERAS